MSKKFKLHEIILSETVKAILAVLLPIILPTAYSTIISWNYNIPIISVMTSIPIYIYGFLCIPFIYLFVRKYYIHKKMNEGKHEHVGSIVRSPVDIDHWQYNDLIWIIRTNEYTLRKNELPTINKATRIKNILDSITISYEPKCPKCGAGLYFQEHDLYYSYDCVNPECSFIKRTWESKNKMRDIAKKQYKYSVESKFLEK